MMMSTMPEPSGLGYRSIMSLSSNSMSLSSSSILVPSQNWCMPGVEGVGGVAVAPSSSSYLPLPPRGFASAPPNPKTSLPLAAIINVGAATKNVYTQQQDQAGNLQEATIDTTSPRGGDTIQQPQHPTPSAASRRAEVSSSGPHPRCCFSRFTSLAEFQLVRKFPHLQQEEETADNIGVTGATGGAGRYMKHHLPPCGRGGGAAAFVNASHLAAPHLLRRRSAAGSSSSSSFLPSASTASGERSVSPQLFEMQAEEDE